MSKNILEEKGFIVYGDNFDKKNLKDKNIVWINSREKNFFKVIEGKNDIVLYGEGVENLFDFMEEESSFKKMKTLYEEDLFDKRGFQPYDDHPLFRGTHCGFYSLFLYENDVFDDAYFYAGKKAKKIACEKRYIDYKPEKTIIWEYDYCDKKILCIGGYLNLSKENPYYAETELFLKNIANYLNSPVEKDDKKSQNKKTNIPLKIELSGSLEEAKSGVDLKFYSHEDTYANTSGERILVNCRGNGTIEEIWAHPFRLFTYLNIFIDSIPLKEQKLTLKTTPEMLEYKNEFMSFVLFASLDKPVFLADIRFFDSEKHDVSVELHSDLQPMWPRKKGHYGPVEYDITDEKCISIGNQQGNYRGYLGFNKTFSSNLSIKENHLTGEVHFGSISGLSFYGAGYVDSDKIPEEISMNEELKRVIDFDRNYLKNTASLKVDDEEINDLFKWSKLKTRSFFTNTPEIGRGLMAGYSSSRKGWFAERPGYAWYFGRDSLFVSLTLLYNGDFESVRENLKLLMQYQRVDGKIYHELTTSGFVHYDAADSTPLFIYIMYKYLMHTGDIDFIKVNYKNIMKAYDYCISTDLDKDFLIENTIAGHGWVEGGALYGSHASFYLNCIWTAAIKSVNYISKLMNDEKTNKNSKNLLKNTQNALEHFWNEKNKEYCLGIDREGKRLDFFTVINSVGVFLDITDYEKSLKTVKKFGTTGFSTDWGTRIISRMNGLYKETGYHEGAIWPLFTGWASLAEYKVGELYNAENHWLANLNEANFFAKGEISEVINGGVYKPTGICDHQAWSQSFSLHSIYEGLLGLNINAPEKSVKLQPQISFEFNDIKLKNIYIGDTKLKIKFKREIKGLKVKERYEMNSQKKLNYSFSPYIAKYSKILSISINGRETAYEKIERLNTDYLSINESFGGKSVVIELEYEVPFILKPIKPKYFPNSTSKLPRITGIEKKGDSYEINVEILKSAEIFLITDGDVCIPNTNFTYNMKNLYIETLPSENKYAPRKIIIKKPQI